MDTFLFRRYLTFQFKNDKDNIWSDIESETYKQSKSQ